MFRQVKSRAISKFLYFFIALVLLYFELLCLVIKLKVGTPFDKIKSADVGCVAGENILIRIMYLLYNL